MGKYTEDCNTMCNISNISQGKCLKIKIKSLEKSHNKFYLILYPSNRRKYHKKKNTSEPKGKCTVSPLACIFNKSFVSFPGL